MYIHQKKKKKKKKKKINKEEGREIINQTDSEHKYKNFSSKNNYLN